MTQISSRFAEKKEYENWLFRMGATRISHRINLKIGTYYIFGKNKTTRSLRVQSFFKILSKLMAQPDPFRSDHKNRPENSIFDGF